MRKTLLLLMLIFGMAFMSSPIHTQAQAPVVHAVLFYSPTCPHCHVVMTEDLPPLREKYGDQLNILEINVTEQKGSELYMLAVETFKVPDARLGVPALFVGTTLLVGENEIPEQFPSMIENGLQKGGIDWPPLPGLTPFIESAGLQTGAATLTMDQKFALDPVGNSIAVAVLVGLLITVSLAGYAFFNKIALTPWPEWVLPVLIVLGVIVAGYLTYIETTNTEAVCGPVGDCNSVQQSEYARLFGILPVGVLGLLGYAGIGIAWGIRKYAEEKQAKQGALAIWVMALLGTVYSMYLTFLEPFVIGATCAWCLSSAIIMALVLWTSTPGAQHAIERAPRRHAHARSPRAGRS